MNEPKDEKDIGLPLPWSAVLSPFPNPDDLWEIVDGEGYFIEDGFSKNQAKFIANAVNSHQKLWDELEEVLLWAQEEKAPLREQEIESIRKVLKESKIQ